MLSWIYKHELWEREGIIIKRILIDGTYYQSGTSYHGGGEYGDVILSGLLECNDAEFGIVFHKNAKLHKMIEKCKAAGWELYPVESFSEVPNIIKENNYKTFYSPLPYEDGRSGVKLPEGTWFIGTFHGVRPVELLDYLGIRNGSMYGLAIDEVLDEAKRPFIDALTISDRRIIITDSQHSKYSLLEHFPFLGKEQIEVLYPPLKNTKEILADERSLLEYCNVNKNMYSLMVSGGIWYKNATIAAIAYDRVFDNEYSFIDAGYKVVITGVDKAMANEVVYDHVRNKDRFVVQPYLPEDYLEILYKNAHTFMYPSLDEGFGYPPLEAMKYGTICACAASSSIVEICGDMCIYFNPVMIGEIYNRILQSFSEDIRI